jgi:2-polyprenyl-6-methoxyphenol hydroxylase-like FAD-dependent oxidoreductase
VPKIISDPDKVKEEALNYMQGWPVDIQECIKMTPLSSFSRGVIWDRWSIPFMTPQQEMNGVTLAGDASHPMTPNLAQGGCTALEDSIVLVRKLYEVLKLELSKPTDEDFSLEHTGIGVALADYQSERWPRTFGLTVKSYIFGALLGWDLGLICFIRDNIALPFMFRASAVLGHSKYDCGQLPSPP